MTRYIVTAAAVVAKTDSETGEGYFYRDAVLPEAASDRVKADQARLAELKLVAEFEPVEVVVTVAETEVDPIADLDLTGLQAYAVTNGIDLGRATSEDGIRAKIVEARAAQA